MDKIEILKELDALCCDINSLWHKSERLKHNLAKQFDVSTKTMVDNNVFVPDNYKSK